MYYTLLFLVIIITYSSIIIVNANPSPSPSRLPVRLVHGTPTPPISNPGIRTTPTPIRFPKNITGPNSLRSLAGNCYTLIQNDYEYSLCPFTNVTQKQTNNVWNAFYGILGIFDSWNITEITLDPIEQPSLLDTKLPTTSTGTTTSSPSPTVSVSVSATVTTTTKSSSSPSVSSSISSTVSSTPMATLVDTTNPSLSSNTIRMFTTQWYNDGTDCASGKKRRTKVSFICSGEGGGTVLKEVTEPVTCEYSMVLACPQACTADYRVGYEDEPTLPALTPTPSPTATVSSSTTSTPTPTPNTPTPTTSPSPTVNNPSSSSLPTTTATEKTTIPMDILIALQDQLKEMQKSITDLTKTVAQLEKSRTCESTIPKDSMVDKSQTLVTSSTDKTPSTLPEENDKILKEKE